MKEQIRESYNNSGDTRYKQESEGWKLDCIDNFSDNLSKEQKKVLDLGAGSGIHGKQLSDLGYLVTCTDISDQMIELCKKRGLESVQMDYYAMSFEDNSFDGVWAMNTLLHVPKKDLGIVLNEIKRVLKPDGVFFMGVYGGNNFEGILESDNYTPKRFFSFFEDQDLTKVLSNYFDIVQFETIDFDEVDYKFQSIMMKQVCDG